MTIISLHKTWLNFYNYFQFFFFFFLSMHALPFILSLPISFSFAFLWFIWNFLTPSKFSFVCCFWHSVIKHFLSQYHANVFGNGLPFCPFPEWISCSFSLLLRQKWLKNKQNELKISSAVLICLRFCCKNWN